MNTPIDFRFETDDDGLRVHGPTLQGNPIRILALGDSCTFGLGVDDRQTWPAQLQEQLNSKSNASFVVRNAGVPGYSSFQGLRYLEQHGVAWHPEVVVASFGPNDEATWVSKGDLEIAHDMALAPLQSLLQHSRLFAWSRSKFKSDPPATSSQGRPRLLPGETRTILKKMNTLCAKHGAKLVFLLWPWQRQVRAPNEPLSLHQQVLLEVAAEEHIPLINPIPSFQGISGPLYVDDLHGSGEGYSVAANLLAGKIAQLCSRATDGPRK